jgi:PadR family transcriptional regulator
MKLLTRSEEMLLLAVWRLQDKAYGVTIREQLENVTGRSWAFGALFVSLDRLVRKGHLASHFSDPLPVRGGRRKRMYSVSPKGKGALIEIRQVEKALWHGIPESSLTLVKA